MGSRKRVTQAEADKMKELRAQGMTYRAIGEELGRSAETVKDVLRRQKEKPEKLRGLASWLREDNASLIKLWVREGLTSGQIAERMGITHTQLVHWRDMSKPFNALFRKARIKQAPKAHACASCVYGRQAKERQYVCMFPQCEKERMVRHGSA